MPALPSSLRVALVHPYPWPEVRRGAERYLEDLSGYLAGRGHDVTVVTGSDGPGRDWRRPDGVRMVVRRRPLPVRGARIGLSPVETFGAAALVPLLRGRFDLVHALTPTGAIAGRLSGAPTLYSVLGHPHPDQRPPGRVRPGLFSGAVRFATEVAVLSEASARALEVHHGRAPVVLPPGVELGRFPADLGRRAGAPRVLFSASLSDRRKRLDLAVAAFALLLRARPDARLLLSGEGDPSWAIPAGPEGAVVREALDVLGAGTPDEVPARYRQATVTVLPAEHEAFGLAIVESLASGTPVVCTASGGMPELVDDTVGRVAAAADPAALACALGQVLTMAADTDLPRRCRHRARQWAWDDAVGPRHEAVYATLTAGRRGRP